MITRIFKNLLTENKFNGEEFYRLLKAGYSVSGDRKKAWKGEEVLKPGDDLGLDRHIEK